MKSLGCASISLPTINFCKLPPDSDLAVACAPLALTLKRAMMPSACFARSLIRIQPILEIASFRVSIKLCAKPMLGTAPRPRRSSGTNCTPKLRRCAGPRCPTSLPNNVTIAASARVSSPDKAYINSRCPLPETPAIPTTSPALTFRETAFRFMPN